TGPDPVRGDRRSVAGDARRCRLAVTPPVRDLPELGRAAWHTWGARGLARRAGYEALRRSGGIVRFERRWQQRRPDVIEVGRVGVSVPVGFDAPEPGTGIDLYGGLHLDVDVPPAWHLHPLTGHRYPSEVHWSALSDSDAEAGDIKDVWDLSRFGWLMPLLRRWAVTGDEALAERIWTVVEDWSASNPAYRGVHWMCGQETSLRTIVTLFIADALRESAATTAARRRLVGDMVFDAVGRVAPTVGYALSQRNNHATSEAGFLWTATLLAPGLPDAERLRRRAASALTEAVADQFAADGSYSQHSATYQRVAMQVLLWCVAVARSTGHRVPDGVERALSAGAAHLRSLLVPDGDGAVPNLGHNDGAHVFPLTSSPIGDFRPLLVHTRAALGATTDIPPGPWDEEAAWFGSEARRSAVETVHLGELTRAMASEDVHVVFRAGPLGHRPAHADQLHVDVWFDGRPVAIDAGSYRYTALPPWANALADEGVHNVPRVDGDPQAVRAGRFFWRRWSEAEIVSVGAVVGAPRIARLRLPGGSVLVRSVTVEAGRVEVIDRLEVGTEATVRWNLADPFELVATSSGSELVAAGRWRIDLTHAGVATVSHGVDDDPSSGWASPTYAVRSPIQVVEVPLVAGQPTVTVFTNTAARS
ncbi:MAG: heparinase II/III-family protein, partial [Acidimicrobiales bacterium]|nr:heparinase II/III-family protein [Acidimicrobiales bacterium]